MFFFEKKPSRPRTKKLLLLVARGRTGAKAAGLGSKSFFASFFQKKKTLPFFRLLRIQSPHDGCGTV
jgi:hypothetical protein